MSALPALSGFSGIYETEQCEEQAKVTARKRSSSSELLLGLVKALDLLPMEMVVL